MQRHERILINGANGMLAHALLRTLKLRRLNPIALTRPQLDITNADAQRDAFTQYKPTLIFNCAAHTKVDLCEQQQDQANAINGHAVGALATLAKEHGAKLIHYSTDFVFDGRSPRPYSPSDQTNPLSAYGRSKLLGEQKLQEINPPNYLLIRTSWVYGPTGSSFPQTILNAARAGKPLRVVNDQLGSPTYTRDLADATLALIDANASGLFHITNSGQTNWFDFARAILDEFNLNADLQPICSSDWQKMRPQSAIRPAYSVLDCSGFTRATGQTLRSWHDALTDYRHALEQPAD